ncbi:MAG: hypothetical protein ISR58_05450, partial [Anaerolineales bacterium]|nr:hypothetical protein [Anaerolineales bacterium]
MSPLQELNCVNCGAIVAVDRPKGAVVSCEYCGTSFRVPSTMTPQPELGDLILGADFREPKVPGWIISYEDKVEFKNEHVPELWANFPPADVISPVIRTPAPFDDFDVSVTIRFIKGNYEQISAGLELRYGDEGDYVFRISAQGTFQIGWHKEKEWGDTLMSWTSHPNLRTEMGDPNRLRVVLRGERIRVYLNGVLATSLRDDHFSLGLIRVVISPGSDKP